jgi:hypothetical protein
VKARSDKTEIRRLRLMLRWTRACLTDVLGATEREQEKISYARSLVDNALAPRRARAKGKA